MSDLRNQIENLSAAERADLLDVAWESLEAEAQHWPTPNAWSWITASSGMSKILPMSSPGSKWRRACSRNRDAPGRLATRGGRCPERSAGVVWERPPGAWGAFRAGTVF